MGVGVMVKILYRYLRRLGEVGVVDSVLWSGAEWREGGKRWDFWISEEGKARRRRGGRWIMT